MRNIVFVGKKMSKVKKRAVSIAASGAAFYPALTVFEDKATAVFYLVKTWCLWRNLPKDFPKRKTVYSFYRRACLNGIWDKIQKTLVKKVRLAKCRKETPSYALIYPQSAKTVSSNEKRGYDGGFICPAFAHMRISEVIKHKKEL